jgi:predicted SAM-dependent methyltransferase
MLAAAFKTMSDTVAWLTRARRVTTNGRAVKLNLGSSLSVCEGWINIDGSHHVLFRTLPRPVLTVLYEHSQMREALPEVVYLQRLKRCEFVHHNLIYGVPFPDNSAEYIYTSHFLEHLYPDDARFLLREAWRVLKARGRIRVCVPDLQHAVRLYLQGEKEAALEYFFQPSTSHSYERHRYMFDFEILRSALRGAGFDDIEQCAYQQGRVPDLDVLDNRPHETLYVEATK